MKVNTIITLLIINLSLPYCHGAFADSLLDGQEGDLLNNTHSQHQQQNKEDCSSSRGRIIEPRVEVTSVTQNGNHISGYIEGVCIVEAGVYQSGSRIQNIPVEKSTEFKRIPFEVTLHGGKSREIRAYNSHGDTGLFPIADPDYSNDPLGLGPQLPEN